MPRNSVLSPNDFAVYPAYRSLAVECRREVLMFRNALAIVLAALMVLPSQGAQKTTPTVQEQIGRIAKGSVVEVKTKLKEMKKVTGRLGEVTTEGFEVQVARGERMDNVRLRFADVRSVAEKTPRKGTHPAVWVVLGGAVAFLVLLVLGATIGQS